MRASRMLYFFVHYAVVTIGGEKPATYTFDDRNEGFLAHYRNEDNEESSWRDTYSGLVVNDFTNQVHFMDDYIQKRQERVRGEFSFAK